ncbi:MAG: hypothetical protein GX878_10405, partial [Firmicutes bacterium]|nr:hypothetical protein [Bacillota bacterium]
EIDVTEIETIYIDLLRQLIGKKKFKNLLHRKRFLVAVDGTQKYVMRECWDERCLRRKIPGKEGEHQYYAYVLDVAANVYCPGIDGVNCPGLDGILGQDTP